MKIPFNRPYLSGKEMDYMGDAVSRGKLSGNGYYTKKCHAFFQDKYSFKKCLLTTSCTDALEMAAILCDIKPGDEIIMPSFTFVSTANAFVLRGANIVFTDSRDDHPGMNENEVESLITPNTKAIVVVHYAGVACNMDLIMDIAVKYDLLVVEDAAQAIDSFYKGKPLGGIGHLGCFSFHETKNIQCGEGGMLVVNDERLISRAEIIWEKGTNRVGFQRGEVKKYSWIDIGSSFLPSELNAAFLYAQLENLDSIQKKRIEIWTGYNSGLRYLNDINQFNLPSIPEYATNNGHIFYLICPNQMVRDSLIIELANNDILSVFHYLSLNRSSFYKKGNQSVRFLTNSEKYSNSLIRLPIYVELRHQDVIIKIVKEFCHQHNIS